MKSISIVSTTMQLLNSVELIRTLEIDENELLILASTKKRKEQIVNVINKLAFSTLFNRISTIDSTSKCEIINSFSIKKQLRKFFSTKKCIDFLILSNYKELFVRYSCYYVWKTNPSVATYVVDDGLSLSDIVIRRQRELETQRASLNITSRQHYWVFPVSRLKKCIAPQLVFFTNQDNIDIKKPDALLRNNNYYLRQANLNQLNFDGNVDICIIGQPLPQLGIIAKKDYNDIISCFINSNNRKDGKIIYIPHPAEDTDDVLDEELLKIVEITHFELPIEIYALKFSPSVIVVSLYSAALFNIHKTRPDLRVVCLHPVSDSFNNSQDVIEEAYSTLQLAGIERCDCGRV